MYVRVSVLTRKPSLTNQPVPGGHKQYSVEQVFEGLVATQLVVAVVAWW